MRCRDEGPNIEGLESSDKSMSSDLCHDRCACMAGHRNILIKLVFSVLGGIARDFARGLPFGVVCTTFRSAFIIP